MADAALPEDLAEIQRGIAESDRRVRALLADLSEEQLNWRPDERSWSVAQCLDHLNVANDIYLGPMSEAVAAARSRGEMRRGPLQPGPFQRWFVRSLEPGGRKFPAPHKIVPAARKSRAEVEREWERVQARLAGLLRDAAPLDLNAARFRNPILPLVRFSVGTGFRVMETHERRHLLQAERVRNHPSFPKP